MLTKPAKLFFILKDMTAAFMPNDFRTNTRIEFREITEMRFYGINGVKKFAR